MNRTLAIIAAFVVWTALAAFAGWKWNDKTCDLADARNEAATGKQALQVEQQARETEHKQAAATQSAADIADTRQDKINDDYDARIAAALAGRDSELGRLRKQWAGCETNRLSGSAAVAAEAAEEDRLRQASAARALRAVELAQSERDETIDRYQAIQQPQVIQ
ncbi:hypothetical protein [Xanthomonas rydalmerensis]|uniref:Endopeptidase n=1 Tax=Xanthomonas rydalmerensis TaxID=3046274 RepID=A0ABZ0JLK5_9XANT|nr:hypothetical protein [Xanthomonas sp. DM-2023]WOS40667.1 hypothetical protein QN243_20115 [Xanthomonas sp. DM-2023]WOS44851.1 hypothetical protein QN242_20115 [Xanthomonas sp. DM-2023]WOS49031.1 hypothetical protein QN240_20115 [Xanthomonas sp. DM-2023]WOS53211.1 hypothetical protein QN244_20120 [Xanthomonas sp. DM-2023]WOS57394.1 hypothetical protein QN245_20115 [Xanthomonas sp. DM-2023]